MSANYHIYSGFVYETDPAKYGNLSSDEWFDLWLKNTNKFNKPTEKGPGWKVFTFGPDVPKQLQFKIRGVSVGLADEIGFYDNLGHIGDYIHGHRHGRWCGWTAGVVFGMMHAYLHNVDFLYKEQDCLWFGQDIVGQMYRDLGDKDIVFGSCKLMGPAQSLFLVRRNTIPQIIASLAQDDDKDVLPEYKFARLPNHAKLSFGYDRDRPFNVEDPHWYIQQVTEGELDLLRTKGLV